MRGIFVHGTTAVGGIDFVVQDGQGTVEMWGEIDVDLRNQASAAFANALESDLPVLIDTSRVTFIDSTGIAFLFQLHTIGQQEGVEVRLLRPPPAVADVLAMLGLDRELAVVDDAAPTSAHPAA